MGHGPRDRGALEPGRQPQQDSLRLTQDLQPPELSEHESVLLSATQLVAIGPSSPRKLIQKERVCSVCFASEILFYLVGESVAT